MIRGDTKVLVLSLLAKAQARSEPPTLKRRVEQAWRMRWGAILSCAAARAFAASLLELKHGGGVDGDVPSTHDVVNDFRHTGLSPVLIVDRTHFSHLRPKKYILELGGQLTPPVVVWRGDSALPSDQQGVTILGTPLGHVDFVRAHEDRGTQVAAGSRRSRARSPVCMVDSLLLRGHPGELLPPHPSGLEEFAATHDAAS